MSTGQSRELAALRLEVADLRLRVAALEAARPRDRDHADAALRQQLADGTFRLPFKVRGLLERAAQDPVLAAALAEATLQTAGEIGCWLRGAIGVRDGICIEHHGRRWRVYRVYDT